jgi:hypothetical protein
MQTYNDIPADTRHVMSVVSSRFFLIQPDGSLRRLNEYGKAIEWCWKQRAAALRAAGRDCAGVRVFDKETRTFI